MSAQKKGGWGFSNLVANLESRLDTILAEDSEASAKERAALEAAKANRQRSNSGKLATPTSEASSTVSRDASRTRANDRLAERLARATAQKPPSRVPTPANEARSSGESKRSGEIPRTVPGIEIQQNKTQETDASAAENAGADGNDKVKLAPSEPGSLTTSALPINPARVSLDSVSRDSAEVVPGEASSRVSMEGPNGTNHTTRSSIELQTETDQMQSDHVKAEIQQQDEMHAYLERIDALQAKLTYLAKETVAAAREANAAAATGSPEEQLAKKDEKIALLMEEGEKLSKNEMRHLQTIKKLRMKATEDEKSNADLRKRLERAEKSEADLKTRLRKAEVAERQANEKTKQIAVIEKQVDELKVDRENAAELVRSLTAQLKESKEKAEKAEREASEADKGEIAGLQNELEDAQIEKKLAEDRANAEVKKSKDEAQRQLERFAVRELELKNEISGLESRLEAMRARAEEASSGPGAEGESSVKLMRQVETLQQQYALAKGNWETIEGSLNARVAALEKERDETNKRETDVRKKAREVGAKSRKAEEELESSLDRVKQLEQNLKFQQEQSHSLQIKLEQASTSQSDARAEFEKQRKLWDVEFSQRLEEEKIKWRREMMGASTNRAGSPRTESHSTFARKPSGTDVTYRTKPLSRLGSHDLSALHIDQRPTSRRSSAMPPATPSRALATPTEASPSISRRESMLSFDPNNNPLTPSIEIDTTRPSESGDFEDFNSPQRTIADLVSTSTAGPGAGPSVQLVERMSSLVRKLESEKASFKDELSRLSAQRDDARNEVVGLMREIEGKRHDENKVKELEKEIGEVKGRYEASLEMLGEREEEVEELRSDVAELKRIYRELVETKVGGSGGSS